MSQADREALARLSGQKTQIEAPLRRRARFFKWGYIILYLVLIGVVWWLLNQLVVWQQWDNLEPITWIVSIVLLIAAPLLAWLKPNKLSPGAVEGRLFDRWRAREFTKYGFDSSRYEELQKRAIEEKPTVR